MALFTSEDGKHQAVGYVEVDYTNRKQRLVSDDPDFLVSTQCVLEERGVKSELTDTSLDVDELSKNSAAWSAACDAGRRDGNEMSLSTDHHGGKAWVTIFKVIGCILLCVVAVVASLKIF